MSTSFNALLANDAAIKASRIVEKAISKGVRGVDGLKVVENVGDNSLKVKILAGTYVYEPDLLIWSDSDLVIGGFTAATTERFDVVYLDVVCDTAIPAPDGGMVVKIAEDAASVPADEPGHRNIGLWRIHRSAGTSVLTQAEIDAGQDLRIIPAEVAHTHNLAAGAVDVAASAGEINQALAGITADVTAARLSELSGSDPTADQLNELVGGDTTVLHSHNSTNSIETPAGTAIPVDGVLKVTQSGQAQVSAAGDTINIHVATDNLGNHTATQDLNMVDHKVKNVADGTADQDAINKRQLDAAVLGGLDGYAKYNAEQDFDLNPTAAPIGKRIHNLEDGAVEKDAINKGQLDDAIDGLGGSLANLDERYKLGLPGGPTDPSAPNFHLNKQAHGNVDLHDYKMQNSGSINKLTDAPETLVTKQYVDDEIAEAVEDITGLISGFFKNPAETDLIMTGPYGAKNIVALQLPMTNDQAANKEYVDIKIAEVTALIPTEPGAPTPGDHLGNHTATTNLNMNYKAVGRLVMPHQTGIIGDLTEGDMLAVNRKYLFDALTGAIDDIPQEELPDFSRFAKLGVDFEADKNVLPLNMAVQEGGEVNVRGTDGRGLLVIKKKPNDAPGEDVFINSRIQGVEDPIDDNDAVNFRTLKYSSGSVYRVPCTLKIYKTENISGIDYFNNNPPPSTPEGFELVTVCFESIYNRTSNYFVVNFYYIFAKILSNPLSNIIEINFEKTCSSYQIEVTLGGAVLYTRPRYEGFSTPVSNVNIGSGVYYDAIGHAYSSAEASYILSMNQAATTYKMATIEITNPSFSNFKRYYPTFSNLSTASGNILHAVFEIKKKQSFMSAIEFPNMSVKSFGISESNSTGSQIVLKTQYPKSSILSPGVVFGYPEPGEPQQSLLSTIQNFQSGCSPSEINFKEKILGSITHAGISMFHREYDISLVWSPYNIVTL